MAEVKDYLKSFYNGLPSLQHWKTLRGDNIVLSLHFPLTTILLLIAGISSSELFSSKIDCIGGNYNVDQDYVNSHCLSMPLYDPDYSQDVPSLCMFYDWVPFMFYISAFLFFAPRFLFRHSGGFVLCDLLERKDVKNLSTFETWTKEQKRTMNTLVNVVYDMWGSNKNNVWMCCVFACDMLNLLNVILQFTILHFFMSSTFYGLGVTVFDAEQRFTELNHIFPKTVHCNVSGVQYFCRLTKNFWNQKLFFIAWMWLVFLGVATICSLVDRCNRYMNFKRRSVDHVVRGNKKLSSVKTSRNNFFAKCKFGDVLMFQYLSMHLEEPVFHKLIDYLAYKCDRERIRVTTGI